MRKADKIVYIALGVLFAAVLLFAFLNRSGREIQRALEENREFLVRVDGEYAATVTLQMLLDLGPQEFKTSFSTSIAAPREVALQGVELRLLFEALGIDVSNADYFAVSGLDGYYSPLTPAEVHSAETIYICYSMDGEILKTMGEGGFGPFMLVIRGSLFAQRWCKYVEAVDVINA